MRLFRQLAAGLGCLVLSALPARAESPLRLLPAQADLLLEIKQPRRLVETIQRLDTLQQFKQFANVQEYLRSTRARQVYQLVAYFEKELGAPWPELLDRLAGGGVALGVKFGPNPAPSLLVVRGKDEKDMKKFARLALGVLEQELARRESSERPVKESYQGIDTVRVGKDFHAAVAGPCLLVATSDKALHAGLDLYLGREKKSLADVPGVTESRKLLPGEPLVNLWLNMKTVRLAPEARQLYKMPRDNAQLTVLAGGLLDVLGRTPFVSAGLCRDNEGLLVAVRMPRGREGMGPDAGLHTPPAGQPGTRPPLLPKGTFFSDSFYLDLARLWQDRDKLFNEKQARALADFDKNASKFLVGNKVSKLLSQVGPYHRVVVVNQPTVPYKTKPKQPVPAFAVVSELREPEAFGKSMEAILRGAALLASFQVKLKMVQEKHNDCKIIGFRFPEDAPFAKDVNDIRFNFSPCFTRVGNQYVWCSTIELCRELVDLLQKEGRGTAAGSPATVRMRLPGAGAAGALQAGRDALVAQAILDQAVAPAEARAQVDKLIALVRGLGSLEFDILYGDRETHYDIRLPLATGKSERGPGRR